MQIMAEWAGHYYDPAENSDKIWAGSYTDTGDYLCVWGRRGNRKYQSLTKQFGSATAARLEFTRMVHQKEHKGYRSVPFENPRFGNISSFRHSVSGNTSTLTRRITKRGLLEHINQLITRVRAHFEPDIMLVEFNQLRAIAGLVLEYDERLGNDHDREVQPHELETGLDTLSACIRQALLA